jgi:hypothetical protein
MKLDDGYKEFGLSIRPVDGTNKWRLLARGTELAVSTSDPAIMNNYAYLYSMGLLNGRAER